MLHAGYIGATLAQLLGVGSAYVSQNLRFRAPVLIGDPDDAVVFDFRPGIDAGAQMLGRRGEDQRFEDPRPAARRRRDIDDAMAERAEGEERADVARRLGRGEGQPDSATENVQGDLVEDLVEDLDEHPVEDRP